MAATACRPPHPAASPPHQGSGGIGRTNVGGPDASFGVWHELLPEIERVVARHGLVVERVHTHIGSGSNPAVWTRVSQLSLKMCQAFPTVTTLNLGGGYKVRRMHALSPAPPPPRPRPYLRFLTQSQTCAPITLRHPPSTLTHSHLHALTHTYTL